MTMTTTPVLQTKQKRVERSSFPFLLAFGKILVNRENKDQRKRRRGVCVVCEVKEHGVRAVRGGGTKCLHATLFYLLRRSNFRAAVPRGDGTIGRSGGLYPTDCPPFRHTGSRCPASICWAAPPCYCKRGGDTRDDARQSPRTC